MKNKYQIEYENSNGCFWEPKPAKYVRMLINDFKYNALNKYVLDLGAGEGKNAVYLANLGSKVIGVDISDIALSRFILQPNYESCKHLITQIKNDIRDLEFNENQFDLIIAYGVFHTLSNVDEILAFLDRSKNWLKAGGYYIIATFTDEIPAPKIQDYLDSESFVNYDDFLKYFAKWNIINNEKEIIEEVHPTSKLKHKHSIVRILVQKNDIKSR